MKWDLLVGFFSFALLFELLPIAFEILDEQILSADLPNLVSTS
jgi:hypothetical protein